MPIRITRLPDGDLYLINYYDENGCVQVQRFDRFGVLQKKVRQFTVEDGDSGLEIPAGLGADEIGNIYIVDMDICCVKKYSPEGILLASYGREGEAAGELSEPDDIVVDPSGGLYIADAGNNRIQKWDENGNCVLIFGLGLEDDADEALLATDEPGGFDGPQSIALDREGNLWVADTNNHRLQKFNLDGKLLNLFGEEGKGPGQFYYPNRVRIDLGGSIYVNDSIEGRLQKFDPEGRFIYQVILPLDSGKIDDFDIDDDGHIWLVLRSANLALKIEIE